MARRCSLVFSFLLAVAERGVIIETIGLEPAEQQTILFYDKPLIVVRLPNGEPGAVLRYFCDNLGLAQNRQIDRIKRKKALAAGLHYARIETEGGPQVLELVARNQDICCSLLSCGLCVALDISEHLYYVGSTISEPEKQETKDTCNW